MRDMIRPTFVLFIICLIVGAAMAFTNFATADKIEQRIIEESEKARKTVLPDADEFIKINLDKIKSAVKDNKYEFIKEAYLGKINGNTIGYVFLAKTVGYAGDISIMIGIGSNGEVSGVEIGDNKETPGLGTKAKDQEFKGQYNNKKYSIINVVKRPPQQDDEIQAISGATITSKAVSLGVQQASQLADALMKNELGVNQDELIEVAQ